MNEKQKLDSILKENPDPTKWSKWLKLIIKVLVLIVSAITGDVVSVTDLF